MEQNDSNQPDARAPADRAQCPPWPAWKKVLAYALLAALALVSVWVIDRKI